MHPQLVGAARYRAKRHPGRAPAGIGQGDVIGNRVQRAVFVLRAAPDLLAIRALGVLDQPAAHLPGQRLGRADHHRPIDLQQIARAKRFAQFRRRRQIPRNHQQPAGVAIQTMHEARPLAIDRQRIQHAIDMARRARAALHGKAGRLVQHHDAVVFIDDHVAQRVAIARRDRPRLIRRGPRRR